MACMMKLFKSDETSTRRNFKASKWPETIIKNLLQIILSQIKLQKVMEALEDQYEPLEARIDD
ncbi:hypothetical protein SESBI_09416 [Sesbania bispinosa]|nr:hypothetical protein SESBI_09416 [Sesbania bispinosa]